MVKKKPINGGIDQTLRAHKLVLRISLGGKADLEAGY